MSGGSDSDGWSNAPPVLPEASSEDVGAAGRDGWTPSATRVGSPASPAPDSDSDSWGRASAPAEQPAKASAPLAVGEFWPSDAPPLMSRQGRGRPRKVREAAPAPDAPEPSAVPSVVLAIADDGLVALGAVVAAADRGVSQGALLRIRRGLRFGEAPPLAGAMAHALVAARAPGAPRDSGVVTIARPSWLTSRCR